MRVPLAPGELRGIILGGPVAMGALPKRIDAAQAVAIDMYQFADRPTLDALDRLAGRAGLAGRSGAIHVLADHGLPGGNMDDQLRAVVARADGRFATYGELPENYQHAKVYHFLDDASDPGSVETWVTNLAPIPKAHVRTELSMRLGGDAARSSHDVTLRTLEGDPAAIREAVDGAARHGVLYNEPEVGRFHLTEGIRELLEGDWPDLSVITKGIEDVRSTSSLIAARRAARAVQVHVRDVAKRDARRLAEGGVPVIVTMGPMQPRINAIFAGDRAIVSSAFLWGDMVGRPGAATSRDAGVLLEGAQARTVRDAAMSVVASHSERRTLLDALRADAIDDTVVPDHI